MHMDSVSANRNRLAAIVQDLNAALHWGLTDEQQQAYVTDLLRILSGTEPPDTRLRRQITTYHVNHAQVHALQDATHPHHQHAWSELRTYVQRIVWQQAGRSFANAEDIVEEVTQIALYAIHASLHKYGYRAQITTWAHTIILNKYRNYLRDQRILKPPFDMVSMDDPDVPVSTSIPEQPAAHVEGDTLTALVLAILRDEPLMRQAFLLSVAGYKLIEIGNRIGRSTTRAHELIRQARVLIQADPRFRAWLDAPENDDTEQPG